ncbi:MAG: substrate-binding domain-containing protein [Hyphomicrobiales bacterium]|nr:substrate-binding domain-containing protein [Hyphomicrobiales bacterium]
MRQVGGVSPSLSYDVNPIGRASVNTKFVALTAAVAAGVFATGAMARDQIRIVGSSTVYPYSQAVSEEFAKKTGGKAPVVESLGTGGGFKEFCKGVGEDKADIANASRTIKKSEYEDCTKNGVTNITEVLIGYDGLSVAGSKKGVDVDVTKEQLFLALSKEVLDKDGKLVANPYKKWSDIDKKLPDQAILVYGPPPTSGTRDAFVELAMHEGCKAIPAYKDKLASLKGQEVEVKGKKVKADEQFIKDNCSPMRADGAFVEAGENDNLIVQRLEADPKALGIFGYSFLFENADKLKGAKVKGVTPSFETIADGSYGISRPLFFYIKNDHRKVIKGLDEFVAEFVSTGAMGKDGYLAERGLTPLSEAKRKEVADAVKNATNMAAPKS